MCGVPVRSADGYIAKLVEKGHRVAVCEHDEHVSAGHALAHGDGDLTHGGRHGRRNG